MSKQHPNKRKPPSVAKISRLVVDHPHFKRAMDEWGVLAGTGSIRAVKRIHSELRDSKWYRKRVCEVARELLSEHADVLLNLPDEQEAANKQLAGLEIKTLEKLNGALASFFLIGMTTGIFMLSLRETK